MLQCAAVCCSVLQCVAVVECTVDAHETRARTRTYSQTHSMHTHKENVHTHACTHAHDMCCSVTQIAHSTHTYEGHAQHAHTQSTRAHAHTHTICVAVWRNSQIAYTSYVLQCCNVLQCVAVCCSVNAHTHMTLDELTKVGA